MMTRHTRQFRTRHPIHSTGDTGCHYTRTEPTTAADGAESITRGVFGESVGTGIWGEPSHGLALVGVCRGARLEPPDMLAASRAKVRVTLLRPDLHALPFDKVEGAPLSSLAHSLH